MNNKAIGTTFIVTAAFMLALGVVGSQVSTAIVHAGFMSGRHTGMFPMPQQASPDWIIVSSSSLLGLVGLIFLVSRRTS
jgi:hypothetical protein